MITSTAYLKGKVHKKLKIQFCDTFLFDTLSEHVYNRNVYVFK